jgi:hypothetical protein
LTGVAIWFLIELVKSLLCLIVLILFGCGSPPCDLVDSGWRVPNEGDEGVPPLAPDECWFVQGPSGRGGFKHLGEEACTGDELDECITVGPGVGAAYFREVENEGEMPIIYGAVSCSMGRKPCRELKDMLILGGGS